MPDGPAGGKRRRRGGRQGLAPGLRTPAVARRGPGPGSGRHPCSCPASGPGASGGSAQGRGRSGQRWRSGHLGRPADPGPSRRSGTAAAPPGRKAGCTAAVGCWRSRLGRVRARRDQGRGAGRGGRDGTGRERPRRTADPGATGRRTGQPGCAGESARSGGRARSSGQAWSGRQAWSSGPPCRQASIYAHHARTRRWRRGKRHQAGSSRGRGPAIRRNVAGQGPARSGQGPGACEPGARRAALDYSRATGPGTSGLRGRGGSRGAGGAGCTGHGGSRHGCGRSGPGWGGSSPGDRGVAGRARYDHACRAGYDWAGNDWAGHDWAG